MLSRRSAPQNCAVAYIPLPLGTKVYAISPQRTSKLRCSVYFPSFRNQSIRYLATAHLEIAL